jgi:hypothetical protein
MPGVYQNEKVRPNNPPTVINCSCFHDGNVPQVQPSGKRSQELLKPRLTDSANIRRNARQLDNWIAGFCRYYRKPVISLDAAFDRVPGLRRLVC